MDLALNNIERLICHKTQTNKQTILPMYLNRLLFSEVCHVVLIWQHFV